MLVGETTEVSLGSRQSVCSDVKRLQGSSWRTQGKERSYPSATVDHRGIRHIVQVLCGVDIL